MKPLVVSALIEDKKELFVLLDHDTYIQQAADATILRLERLQRELEAALAESDKLSLPPGSQASWRRGVWA